MGADEAAATETVLGSFLFTDLVDSTAIATRLGPQAAEDLRRTHFRLLRDVIAETRGEEVKNLGDGLMVRYSSPSRALSGATAMMRSVERFNRRAGQPVHIRIGLSVGEAYRAEDDYFGEPVVEAARLCGVAAGDQILTTEMVRSMAGRRSEVEFAVAGERELKGLPSPVPTLEVLWVDADTTSPIPMPSMLVTARHHGEFAFVGRVDQLALIDQLHKDTVGGQTIRTLLVGGEAGIGKTAMIAQAAGTAHSDGSIVLLGHCDEDAAAPYQMWRQALGHLHEHQPDLVESLPAVHRTALARLLPALGSVDAPLDAVNDRFALMTAIDKLLAAAAASDPIVLVLDDVHWADVASLHVMRHVLANSTPMSLLVLVTYRHTDLSPDHPLTPLLADLHRLPGVERIRLVGLEDHDVVHLAEAAAGGELDAEAIEFAHAVRRDTDGNAFFAREVIRHVVEAGTDGGMLGAGADPATLPASVRDVIARRVGRLGPHAGRLLAVAAVLGREFDVDLLAAIADHPVDDVLDTLDAACAAALVTERTDVAGTYRFAHALMQRSLYETLSTTRRARYHHRAVDFLEAADAPAADLARHVVAAVRAADAERALHHVLQAADEALAALAPHDAADWYRQALELSASVPAADSSIRCRILIGLGTSQRYIGDDEHRRSLLEAAALARALDDGDLLVESILAADRGVAGTSEADDEWVVAAEAALDVVGPGDSAARARLLSLLSQTINAREWERRRELSTEALRVARRLDDHPTLAAVLPVTYQHFLPQEIDDRLDLTDEAVRITEGGADAIARGNALFHRIDACMGIGATDEADARLAELVGLATATRIPLTQWQAEMLMSMRALLRGDPATSESHAAKAFRVGTDGGHAEAPLMFGTQLIEIRRHQGRLGEAVALMVGSGAESTTGFRQILCGAHAEIGEHDQAQKLLDVDKRLQFATIAQDAAWLLLITASASAAATLRDAHAAERLYDLLAPFDAMLVAVYGSNGGSVARTLGRLAHSLGRLDDAIDHFDAALVAHEAIPAPYWIARTQLDLAAALTDRGVFGDAAHAGRLRVAAHETAIAHDFAAIVAATT